MITPARARLGQLQQATTPTASPTWVVLAQVLGLSFTTFPGTLSQSWNTSRIIGTWIQTSALIQYAGSTKMTNLLSHNTSCVHKFFNHCWAWFSHALTSTDFSFSGNWCLYSDEVFATVLSLSSDLPYILCARSLFNLIILIIPLGG